MSKGEAGLTAVVNGTTRAYRTRPPSQARSASRLVRNEGASRGGSSLARAHYARGSILHDARDSLSGEVGRVAKKPTKLDRLREGVGSGGQSVADLESIAKSVGFWQERFVARPAAELLIEQGAPGAETMQAALETMPITGRDQKADLLRAAFRSALERDGIPPEVERTARAFYEHRRGSVQASPHVSQP